MGKNLAKYNACTHPQTARELDALPGQKEINPTFVGLISFWNPATSYSPGRFPSRSLPPLAARDRKPNQVQCCTWLKTAREQLSPGRFSPCCIAHRARMGKNLAKYNVHSSGDEPKRKRSRIPNEKPQTFVWGFHLESGNVLLSRAVSSQVPSALKGLTSVFGMGTGGSLSP